MDTRVGKSTKYIKKKKIGEKQTVRKRLWDGKSGLCPFWAIRGITDVICQRRNYKKRHSGNTMKPFVFQTQGKHITKSKNKLSPQSLTCYMSFKGEMFVSASCQKIWAESHHRHLHCLCSFNSTTLSNERKENYPRNFR